MRKQRNWGYPKSRDQAYSAESSKVPMLDIGMVDVGIQHKSF